MYRRSTVILAASAAVLWSTALVLVLLQIKRITPQPLALLCAVMAAAASVIARVSLQQTPVPVPDPWMPSAPPAPLSTVVESRWTPKLGSQTTVRSLPAYVSQPVPVQPAAPVDRPTERADSASHLPAAVMGQLYRLGYEAQRRNIG